MARHLTLYRVELIDEDKVLQPYYVAAHSAANAGTIAVFEHNAVCEIRNIIWMGSILVQE